MHQKRTTRLTLAAALLLLYPAAGRPQEKTPSPAAPSVSNETDYSKEPLVYEQVRGIFRYENDGKGTKEVQARLRIQSYVGVQKAGQLVFNYNAANERMEVRSVRVIKPDGRVVTAGPEAVQDMTAPVAQQAPMYTDLRQKHVIVPGLSAGDTLEYDTVATTFEPLAPGQIWLAWDFISDDICLDERVELSVPRSKQVKLLSPPNATLTIREEGGRQIYRWVASNSAHGEIPHLTQPWDVKNLMKGLKQPHSRRLFITTFPSWQEVGEWYAGLERERRIPTTEVRAKAEEITRGAKSDLERVQALYEYVSRNIRYVSLSFGLGRYQPHAASEVLTNQYGDCKDKATLFEALLEAIGLHGAPALISTESDTDQVVASPLEFDHAISFLEVDGREIWLDSTAGVAPFGYLFPQLRGKNALVVFPGKKAELRKTPESLPMPALYQSTVEGSVNDSGKLEARLSFDTRGDWEVLFRAALLQVPIDRFGEYMTMGARQTASKADVSFADLRASDPFDTRSPFHIEGRITATIPEEDLFSAAKAGPAGKPVDADLLKFLLPVFPVPARGKENFLIGEPKEMSLRVKFAVAPKYGKLKAPGKQEPVHLTTAFAEYDGQSQWDGQTFTGEWRLALRANMVPAAEYVNFRDEVLRNLLSSRAVQPSESVQSLHEAGMHAFNKGDYSTAQRLLESAVVKNPKSWIAWNNLGRTYLNLGLLEKAAEAFQKTIALNPKDQYAYNNLGLAFWRMKRFDEAIQSFQKQIEISPKDRYSHANLGKLYVQTEQYNNAEAELKTAVSITPWDASLHVSLGRAYLKLAQHQTALEEFQRAVSLDAGWVTLNDAAYYLADADLELERAAAYAGRALADTEEKLNQIQLEDMNAQGVSLLRHAAAVWDTVGWVKFRQADLGLAEKYIRAAQDLTNDSTISFHLGRVYEAQGRKEDAIQAYEEALAPSAMVGIGGMQFTVPGADNSRATAPPTPDEREAKKRLTALAGDETRAAEQIRAAPENRGKRRSVVVPYDDPYPEEGVLLLLFAPGPKIDGVRQLQGTSDLKDLMKRFDPKVFPQTFPDSATQKIARVATLVCSPEKKMCTLLFLSTELSVSAFSSHTASVPSPEP